ncbi:MAG: TrkA family potassium uptake protein [Deltaproteobacteria bacterium]|nr:MAG: TrkA family potassium uptake protein [Deltaproteobacteria bacterium]
MHGEFAVIGLGRFGTSLALNLARQGQSVLAIDVSEDRVERLADEVDAAMTADTTQENVLDELRLGRIGTVIVAIGAESREASILTTALLRQRGTPRIVARAVSELHGRVLTAVGAHEIINPEDEMGARVAMKLAQPSLIDRLALGHNAELAEVETPEAFVGESLMSLDIRNRYHVSVVAIRRVDDVVSNPRATEKLRSGDILLVIGNHDAIRRLAARA